MKDYGVFGSSEDSTKIGDTVKGLIIGLASVLILVAKHFDVPLTETQIVEIAGQLGSAISVIWVLYGLLKKVFVKTVA